MPKHEKKSEAIYNNLLGFYFFFPALNLSKTSKWLQEIEEKTALKSTTYSSHFIS